MIRRLVELSVDHAWKVVAGVLAAAIAAGFFAVRLELDALPDLTNNQVLVLARAPGMTPEELERLVTRPIEVSTGGAPGLVEQRSISRYGLGAVTLVFDDGVPVYLARQLVSERLATLALPASVEQVELGPVTGGLGEIYHFTLSSPARSLAELQELVQLQVAPLLKGVPGVVEVNSWGGAQRTFEARADVGKLSQRGFTLRQLADALAAATGTVPGAALPRGEGQVLLRGQALPVDPRALGLAIVAREMLPEGTPRVTRVADVAEVDEGEQVRTGAATKDGAGEVVYVMAQMLRGANALDVVGDIEREMERVRAALPRDVQIDVAYDRGVLVRGTLKTVAKNLLEGGLLVMVVLFLLLGSFRAGLLVASAIPLSMLFATAAMSLAGVPGNLMSLGAVDFGLLVDGAVVVIEAVFHAVAALPAERREKLTRDELKATVREQAGAVGRPVFFSVLIILLVYVPVLALTGPDGKLFRPMALTVVAALMAALVLSLTFVPAAASLFLRPKDVPRRAPVLVRLLERVYPPVLRWWAAKPVLVGVLAVAGLAVGGALFVGAGTEFTPQLNEGDLVIQTTRRADLSLKQATVEAQELERAVLSGAPEVVQVVSRVGSPAVATDLMGLEQADVFVKLKERDAWRKGLTLEGLIEELDAALERSQPGLERAFTQPIQMRFNELLGGSVTDVAVSVYGEDLRVLMETAVQVREAIARQPGAEDVRVLAPPSVPLATVRPRVLDAAAVGLDAADVLETVRAVRQGREVGFTYRGVVRVPLKLKQAGVEGAADLERAAIALPGGGQVTLARVADVAWEDAPGQVNRRNGARRLMVGFNVRGGDLGTVVEQAREVVAQQVKLPAGTRLEWGGQYEQLQAASKRLAVVIPVVLVVIVAVLLVAFRSVRVVAVVFSHVPFAAVGGLVALTARGLPISLPAAIGFIALAGIAVLNGVVLLSRVQELEAKGLEASAAAREAAHARVRPVLMTALVAAFGFVPMMLAHGPGAEVQRPLATVVVGGLVSSTVLTLVVLPSLYRFFARKRAS